MIAFALFFAGLMGVLSQIVPLDVLRVGFSEGSIINTGVEAYNKPLYIAFSKDVDDSTIAQWQKALDALKESGEYEKIREAALQEAYRDFGIKVD